MGWRDDEIGETRAASRQYHRYQRGESRDAPVVAEYLYQDEKGEPYLQVERRANKQFSQSHWVKKGPGGCWMPGKPKGPKIPYYLPQLIAAGPEVPIFICEGEKDTDTAYEYDVVATCNSEGAGKWTPDLNRWFENRKRVIVFADNDGAGRKHALKVARNLFPIVGEVRIVHLKKLPDGQPMPEKGDLTDWYEAGGTVDQLMAMAEAAPVYRGLRQIQVITGEPARTQDETEAALLDAGQPVLVRAGKLVQPIWTEYPTAKGGKTTVTVLRPMTVTNLAYMTTKHAATFAKYNKREKALVPIDPPESVLKGLLERGHWGFPRVAGVINAPTLRPDGTVLDSPGYDPQTQLWCWPDHSLEMSHIPDPVTREHAEAALRTLCTLLEEFPFVSELDRSVALAAILTAVLRGAFDVAPMFLFLAHAAGSGKSYLVNLVSTIVHGRPCPVITATGNKEEMEKRLGALLLDGGPMISLDNLSENLGGDLLCQMTEQPLVKIRVLGQSQTPECEWRGTMFATGNNVTFEGDMTRRGLIVNLDPNEERPETREFKFNPVERVLMDRGEYIAAAILIARAYLACGEKAECAPLGSYGGWSRFVREPLIWLGRDDPAKSMDQARADDPEKNAAVAMVEAWKTHLKVDESYTVGEIIKLANETQQSNRMGVGMADFELLRPDLNALMAERCPTFKGGIDARGLGKWLSKIKGQVHAGHRLMITKKSASHGNRWALVEAKTSVGDG